MSLVLSSDNLQHARAALLGDVTKRSMPVSNGVLSYCEDAGHLSGMLALRPQCHSEGVDGG